MEIISVNNNLVKETVKLHQKKYRTESGKFILEGYKSIKEAFDYGIKLDYIFVKNDKYDKYTFTNNIILTNEKVLEKVSTTDSAPDAVAVGFQPENNFDKLKTSKKVILLENISDAGNLGTIIRTSAAFGIDTIILYGDTVDVYNPKCVRSAVGNLWKINIVNISDKKTLDKYFSDFERVATLPQNKDSILLKQWAPKEKTLVMFGSEANGLTKDLIDYSTSKLTIEMKDTVESLNLGVSAGIVIYHMTDVNVQ